MRLLGLFERTVSFMRRGFLGGVVFGWVVLLAQRWWRMKLRAVGKLATWNCSDSPA